MSTGLAPTSRVRISEDIVFREVKGEAVLLNLKTGVYFGLDPIGTRIWYLLQEHKSLQEVLDVLLEEYDVTEPRCSQGLLSVVAEMQKQGLIELGK